MYEMIFQDYIDISKYKDLKYNVKYRITNSNIKKYLGKQCEIILHVSDMDSIEKIKVYIYDVYNNEIVQDHWSLSRLHINDTIFSFKNEDQLFDILNSYEFEFETDKEYAQEKINEIKKLYEMD